MEIGFLVGPRFLAAPAEAAGSAVVTSIAAPAEAAGSAVVTLIAAPAEATFVTAPGLQRVSVVLPASLACPAAQMLASSQPPVEAA